MKVNLLGGAGDVSIFFTDDEKNVAGNTIKVIKTTIAVTLPNGTKLTGTACCDTRDQFNKHQGRYFAYKNLLRQDTDEAHEITVGEWAGQVIKHPETTASLAQAARKHYKLCRQDRTVVMNVACPKFFYNTPERRAQREKMILQHLTDKYGPPPAKNAVKSFKLAAK